MKNTLKFFCFLAALILSGTTINGPAFGEKIKVGILLPLTGKLAAFGEIESKSFLMAINEINAAGGINGKKIELIIEDTIGDPEVGRLAIKKLVSRDKVVIVGGGYSSSVTWVAAAVAQQLKVPFLVNTASADRITEQNWDYVFRINPPESEHSKPLIAFLTEVARVKTAAILHENSFFGQFKLKKFLKLSRKLSIRVVMNEGYEAGAVDFNPLIIKVKAKNPDLVYIISNNVMDASSLMWHFKVLNFNPRLFVGGAAGFIMPEFLRNAADAAEFVFSTSLWTPFVPYPGAKNYHNKFVAEYNSPTEYHGAEAYAAMYVIADALKRAKSLTPKDVRDALADTEVMTVFGPVKFVSYNKKTQQNRLTTFLVQWINGKLEIVWPTGVTTHRYVYPVPGWNERISLQKTP